MGSSMKEHTITHLPERFSGMAHITKACIAILLAGLLSVVVMTPPALCDTNEDLKEAFESHNAGRLREAVEIYTEVLEKNPNSAAALNGRGMAYDDLNRPDEALADLNKAIKLSPKFADAYNNRGEVQRKRKQYPKALSDYRKAASLDKKFAEPHFNMALIFENQEKTGAAVKEYQKYLSLAPNSEDRKEIEGKIKSLSKGAKAKKPRRGRRAVAQAKKPDDKAKAKPPAKKPRTRPGAKTWKKAAPSKKPAAPSGVPGMEQVPIPPELLATMAGLGIVGAVIPLVLYIFGAVMLFLIAKKTATGLPWLAFIPIANIFLMVLIAGKPLWWLALVLLPILSPLFGLLAAVDPTDGMIPLALTGIATLVSVVAWLFICIGISKARGKSVIWGILMFIPCTNPIALGYLGLSK